MRLSVLFASAVLSVVAGYATQAADLVIQDAPATYAACSLAGDSTLAATGELGALKDEISSRMTHAISVAKNPDWIGSSSPVYLWANETKVVCGIAYGYLKSGYQDPDTISRCDCFHSRMVQYMN